MSRSTGLASWDVRIDDGHVHAVRDDDCRPATPGRLYRVGHLLTDAKPDRLAIEIVGLDAPIRRVPHMLDEVENRNAAIEQPQLVQPLPVAPGHEKHVRIHAID